MYNSKKILFAPLDWGLGHASRCIPLIRECILQNHEVIIAGNQQVNALLYREFPNLHFLELRGYRIQYAKPKWALPFIIFAQIPKLVSVIRYEKKWLERIIKEHTIEIVFSDNRYGLCSKNCKCYFITHQLQIQIPQSRLLQKMANWISHFYIKKFDACLVPDYQGENMGGMLSQKGYLNKVIYLGNLSRFHHEQEIRMIYDVLVLLSGPEPQRSILENQFMLELRASCNQSFIG